LTNVIRKSQTHGKNYQLGRGIPKKRRSSFPECGNLKKQRKFDHSSSEESKREAKDPVKDSDGQSAKNFEDGKSDDVIGKNDFRQNVLKTSSPKRRKMIRYKKPTIEMLTLRRRKIWKRLAAVDVQAAKNKLLLHRNEILSKSKRFSIDCRDYLQRKTAMVTVDIDRDENNVADEIKLEQSTLTETQTVKTENDTHETLLGM